MMKNQRELVCCKSFDDTMRWPMSDETRCYWIEAYLGTAEEFEYFELYQKIFDYLQLPSDLSLKERISYYRLLY